MNKKRNIYVYLYVSIFIHLFLISFLFSIKLLPTYPTPKNEKIITIKLLNNSESFFNKKDVLISEIPHLQNKISTKQNLSNISVENNKLKSIEKKLIKDNIQNKNIINNLEENKKIKAMENIQKDELTFNKTEEINSINEKFGEKEFQNLSKLKQEYLEENYNEIVSIIYRNLIYPPISGRLGHQGTVYLNFDLNIDGNIENINIEKSSKYKELDFSAMEVIEYSKKEFKKPKERINIKLKINYKL